MRIRIPEADIPELERRGLIPSKRPPAPPVDEKAEEKDFQAAVIREAKRNGWQVYHTYDSRKSESGFTDLVLVRDRVLFRELKSETGVVSATQKTWIEALEQAKADVGVWRPSDWPAIERTLK